MKIGIYSGTFDPVHLGHVTFAKEALKQCRLDKVYFLVEPRPRRKQGVKALEHRQAMVGLAVADEPNIGSIELDHPRFSVQKTLPVLQARFKDSEIAFLMGDDVLGHFTDSEWPGLDDFIESTYLIIGLRDHTTEEVRESIKLIENTRGIKIHYKTFVAPKADHNSRNVRQKLRKGLKVTGIAKKVATYIKDHRLYSPKK